MRIDPGYMDEALRLAAEAAREGEVPVGCVIVDGGGRIIGRGRNMRERKKSALSHAELEAIAQACAARGDWRLDDCAMYVTLEPCPTCAGAAIQCRMGAVVYGARDPAAGCCGSVLNLFEERLGHHPAIYGGVEEGRCSDILRAFFADMRAKPSPERQAD